LQDLDSVTAHAHPTGDTNGTMCWHCHDVHGDGNSYMMQLNAFNVFAEAPNDPCTIAGGPACGGQVPIDNLIGDSSGLTNPMSFTAGPTPSAADYMQAEGPGTGPVCGQCHEAATAYCNRDSCAGHQPGQSCKGCHPHDADFVGEGNCITCHGDTVDVLDYSDGGTRAMIDMDEWRVTGHGATAAYDSGWPGAAFAGTGGSDGDTEAAGCYYCHLEAFDSHPATTTYAEDNPFLLRGAAGNDVCNVCHAAGGGGVDPGPDLQGHDAPMRCDGAEKGPSNCIEVASSHSHGVTPNGTKCWHCHDVHGDGNDYMIHLNAFSNLDSGDPCLAAGGSVGCPNELPVNTTAANGPSAGLTVAIDFQPNAPVSNDVPYLVVGAEVCGVCHQNAVTGRTPTCNQTDCSNGSTHGGGDACTACHPHDSDFLGAGDCIGCHNGSTVDIAAGPRAGLTRRAVGNDFDDSIRESHHVRVLGGAALTVHDCVMCHADGFSAGLCSGGSCTLNGAIACTADKDCVKPGLLHKNQIFELRNVDSTKPHFSVDDGPRWSPEPTTSPTTRTPSTPARVRGRSGRRRSGPLPTLRGSPRPRSTSTRSASPATTATALRARPHRESSQAARRPSIRSSTTRSPTTPTSKTAVRWSMLRRRCRRRPITRT
jgi:hypothetical protein